MMTVRFLIVDAPSTYNVLLGRPSLNAIKAIPSAYHMVIKFPTTNGVGMVRGGQRMARECYSASMKQKAVDNIYVDELDIETRSALDLSPRKSWSLYSWTTTLNTSPTLVPSLRSLLIRFLKRNKDVFAWKQEDIGGIDPAIITHKLSVSPSFKPVKQKRRSFTPERQKAINEEVGKLL